jgi:cytochrome c biogenesis protein CcmG, thiol:disulfide interchange protein DsbE
MKRFAIPLVAFGLLLVVFAVALKRAPEKQVVQSALIGKPAPDFVLPDLADPSRTVRFADFRNRWSLVNVWGTWCVECRVEHPVLLDIRRQDKVNIVGLNYKDNPTEARAWLNELGNPYTVVALDQEGRSALDWGVYGAPETFLVNPQGIVVDKIVGIVTPENWAARLLPQIEGRKP